MKVVIIGGNGHVGTYLVPRLVMGGHEVVNVSRGRLHRTNGMQRGLRSRR